MKVVFLGTPDFAIKPLKALLNSSHEVLAVITQPDKPVGRKAVITPSIVKQFAIDRGVKVLTYDNISSQGVEDLKSLNPDIMITCAYGQILSKQILEIAKYGVINIHASLLPKYRGASPIQWAIINGDEYSGVTIMQTDEGIDNGDIILSKELKIHQGETAGELFDRLSFLGADLIVEALYLIESGKAVYKKQDESLSSHVKMIKKEMGNISFDCEPTKIINLINGLNPWPIAYTKYKGKTLKIYKAEFCEKAGKVAEIISCDLKNGLVIGCKTNSIKVLEVQLEGGKKMPIRDFLVGNSLEVSYILGE